MRWLVCLSLLVGCAEPETAQAVAGLDQLSEAASVRVSSSADELDEPRSAPTRGTVILVVLRAFPADLLDEIEGTLEQELQVEVTRREPIALPRSAYYAPRRRYRADKLLDHLLTLVEDEPDTTRVLGLTEVDISTTKGKFHDWGIFGLAYSPGRAAVVSSRRLRRGAKNRGQLRFRVASTALHEVGHTFGLPHCTEARCPMQDAEGGIANTDASQGHLGPQCQQQLDETAPVR